MKQLQSKGKMVYRIRPLLSFAEVPAYMAMMEKRGLRFDHYGLFGLLAVFRRVTPQETAYCWSYFKPKQFVEIQPYLDLCEDAGWEIAWQFDQNKVFRAMDGRHPVPIYTDEEEKKADWKKAVRWLELGQGIMMLIFAMLCSWFFYRFLQPGMGTAFFSDQIFLLGGGILVWTMSMWYLYYGLRHYKGKPGEESETYSPGKARLHTLLTILCILGACTMIYGGAMSGGGFVKDGVAMVMPLTLLMSRMADPYLRILRNVDNYPPNQRMKGTIYVSLRKCRIFKTLFYVAIVGFLGLFFVTTMWPQEESAIRGSNLYCDTILRSDENQRYDESYYHARNEQGAEKVMQSYLWPEDEEGWERIGITSKRQAEIEERIAESSEKLTPYEVTQEAWDEVYVRGNQFLIRRGNDIWRVENSIYEDYIY